MKILPSISLTAVATDSYNLTGDYVDVYHIQSYGVDYTTGTYAITDTNNVGTTGCTVNIKYKGSGNSNYLTNRLIVLGETLPVGLVNSEVSITAIHEGRWRVYFDADFNQNSIISRNMIEAEAVDASKISLSEGAVLIGNSSGVAEEETPGDIADFLLGLTTGKAAFVGHATVSEIDFTIPTGKLISEIKPNAVTTVKILDNAVTNDKLATMTGGSVKIGDGSGNPTDCPLADAEFPIGDGTTVQAVSMSGDATMDNTGALSIASEAVTSKHIEPGCINESHVGWQTSASRNVGVLACKRIIPSNLKPLLNGSTNNLFKVQTGDIVVGLEFVIGTGTGGAESFEIGVNADFDGVGAINCIMSKMSLAAPKTFRMTDESYFMTSVTTCNLESLSDTGYITIKTSADVTALAINCWAILYYMPK